MPTFSSRQPTPTPEDSGIPREYWGLVAELLRPRERLTVWQWAERNVDYSRIQNYDSPIHGPYRTDFMPFWKEPMEGFGDLNVREVICLKCTRIGATENLFLNAIRFAVGYSPRPTLYVTGDQMTAERFMERRLKRGLQLAESTAKALREARETQHDITFRTMDFQVAWPRSKGVWKQDGWACVICDELSLWPEYSADMARRRTDAYPFPHILMASSPDPSSKRPSDEDPIFVEYERGDMREWRCPDPAGGEFTFEMGTEEGAGLKWDPAAKREDGTWDLERVKRSAWYLTPGGARIENPQRMALVRAGRWVPTASGTAAPGCRSYKLTTFMSPFKAGDFGEIAVAFLVAKANGARALRTFLYEYLAEKWAEKKEDAGDDELFARRGEYRMGEDPGPEMTAASGAEGRSELTFVAVDVQQTHLWYCVRRWWTGNEARNVDGDSALLAFGHAVEWDEIEAVADHWGAAKVVVDAGYEVRAPEVYEYALKCKALPLRGSDGLKFAPLNTVMVDPWQGKKGAGGATIETITWDVNLFRSRLLQMMRGESRQRWMLPNDVPMSYIVQAGSTECVEGEWRRKRGRSQDHLFDCEAMQLVIAYKYKILRFDGPPPPAD